MARQRIAGMLQDETGKYAAWGWVVGGATVTPRFDVPLPPLDGDVDVHGDLENDDPYQTDLMARRTVSTPSLTNEYRARSDAWMVFYRDLYPTADPNKYEADELGFGGDHTFGWGLVNNWYRTGSAQWLDAAKEIADIAMTQLGSPIPYSDPAYVPGVFSPPPAAIVGDGSWRRFGRQLRLMAELHGAGAGAAYTTLMHKLVAIAMEDPAYDATLGFWCASQGPTKSTLMGYFPGMTDPEAQALYDGGVRYFSTFQPPIVIDALRRVLEVATFPITFEAFGPYTAQDIKDKIIAAGRFWNLCALHPIRQYTGEVFFTGFNGVIATGNPFDVYDVWYGSHAAAPDVTFTDGSSYTHDGCNIMMLAAQFIAEQDPDDARVEQYRDFAKLLWGRSSKTIRVTGGSGPGGTIVFGNGTTTLGDDRICLDDQIGRYVNATYQSSEPRYFANNRGELPYVDLLFATPSFGVGGWEEIADSSWIALAPPFVGYPASCVDGTAMGNQGPVSFYANGGAAYDAVRDWYIIFGGGHENYSGTEIYVYITGERQWLRLTLPHASARPSNGDPEASAPTLPASRHTANTMVFMPNVDRLFVCGAGGTWNNGGAFLTAWTWNPNDYTDANNRGWTQKANPPVGTFTYNFVAYYNGFVYVVGKNSADGSQDGLWRYNPLDDTYTHLVASLTMWETFAAMAIDTRRGHLYMFYPGQDVPVRAKRWDLAALEVSPADLVMTNPPVLINANPGVLYDETFDRFVATNGFGQTLYVLDPELLVWTTVTGTGDVPTNGGLPLNPYIHNRWQQTNRGTYVLHNWPTMNVFEYTPVSEDIIPPPPVPSDDAAFDSFSGVPDQVQVGATFMGSVLMDNTGTNLWTDPEYALRSVNPPDNTVWGPAMIALPSSTAPGATATFTATFTAPLAAGTYPFDYQMARGQDPSGLVITDDFDRDNEANLTASGYLALTGHIALVSNRAQSVTSGAEMVYRHPTNIGTAEQYVQAVVDAAGNLAPTATCLILRKDASATRSFYMFEVRYDNASLGIWKCVAASYSQFGSYVSYPSLTPGAPVTLYAEATTQSGGLSVRLRLYINDVLLVERTDSAGILTGTYAGLRAFASSHLCYWDAFEAGPLATPPPTLFGDIAQKSIQVTAGAIQQRVARWRGWGKS